MVGDTPDANMITSGVIGDSNLNHFSLRPASFLALSIALRIAKRTPTERQTAGSPVAGKTQSLSIYIDIKTYLWISRVQLN